MPRDRLSWKPARAAADRPADEVGLLQAIADDPDDELPWRIYADWLEEHGDSEWAELIRLDLRAEDSERRQELADAVLARRLAPFAERVESGSFHRGLLRVHVNMRQFLAKTFQANAVSWFADAGVQGLHLTGGTADWRQVGRSPVLAVVGELSLAPPSFPAADQKALFTARNLAGLHTLRLCVSYSSFYRPLRVPERVACPRLRRLFLPDNGIVNAGLDTVLAWPQAARLTSLGLANNHLRPDAVARLAAAPQLAGLRRLDLSYNLLFDEGTASLAASPHLTGLTHLHLQGCGIETAGALALAASPLRQLRVLDLDNNAIGDEGARALAESPALAGARILLGHSKVTKKCQRMLTKRDGDRFVFSS